MEETTTIQIEIEKINQAYEVISRKQVFKVHDMVFTRGIHNHEHNWLHCIIIGPIKNGHYPVHTTLRDGTSTILHLRPENLVLSMEE